MHVYEMRTYTLQVGKMAEAVKLYTQFGYPALQKGGHDKKLIGYFQADTGMINQLVHLWKFDDDTDRRAHWAAVFANQDFMEGLPPFSVRWSCPKRSSCSRRPRGDRIPKGVVRTHVPCLTCHTGATSGQQATCPTRLGGPRWVTRVRS